MSYCEACGAKIDEGAVFCENCGARIPETFVSQGSISGGGSDCRTCYCVECGAHLPIGALFCENCGARVDNESVGGADMGANARDKDCNLSEHHKVFQGVAWKQKWHDAAKKALNEDLGIILTHQKHLLRQLDFTACDFQKVIGKYIQCAARRGVQYYFLDLGNNGVETLSDGKNTEANIRLLRKVVEVARPKYLFILGDDQIVNVVTWENRTVDDPDKEVESDWAYSSLNMASPWDGVDFNLTEAMRVGRLPTTAGSRGHFVAYFENAMQNIGRIPKVKPFGLSAKIWEAEANDEYRRVSRSVVKTCPELNLGDMEKQKGRMDENLLFFNLHGSDTDEFWFGQPDGQRQFPRAFSPKVLQGYSTSFFLGVEACYGAKYIELQESESILKTAMANKCLAFLGSSRIAFGQSEPEGSCADLVVGEYIKAIAEGETAGDAHVTGVKRLLKNEPLDDSDIKTLAEFSLYGDPSACVGENRHNKNVPGISINSSEIAKGIHIPMPDVRKVVRLCLIEVNAKIEKEIDDYFMSKFMPGGEKIRFSSGKTYRLSNQDLNQKAYSFDIDEHRQIVKIYFTDEGVIHRVLTSK